MTKTNRWILAARIWLFATRMIIVNALNSLSSGLGSRPGWKYYVSSSLGMIFHSHISSLHPGVKISNGEFKACNWG